MNSHWPGKIPQGTGLPPNLDIEQYSAALNSLLVEARTNLDPKALQALLLILRVRIRREYAFLSEQAQ